MASLFPPYILVLIPLHFALYLSHGSLSTATGPEALCRHDGDGVPTPGLVLSHELLMG